MDQKTPLSKFINTTKAHLNRLSLLGVSTVGELLTYFPRTYSDQSHLSKIIEIRTDQINTIKGTLSQIAEIRTKFGKKLLKAKLTDSTGSVDVIWFNQPFLKKLLHNGQQIILSGKAKFELGKITLLSPDYEAVQEKQLHTAGFWMRYEAPRGIQASRTVTYGERRIPKRIEVARRNTAVATSWQQRLAS
jgi:RecG-like helicase